MYYYTTWNSPVGELTLVGEEGALAALWIEGQKGFGNYMLDRAEKNDEIKLFQRTKEWLARYFHGEKPDIDEIPVLLSGTPFQKRVWRLLRDIPYGKTTTYGALAEKVAVQMGKKSMSAQAVGGAVGHNPVSIIIPCHRVVGADGSLTGYAGGIDKKRMLLTLEGVKLSETEKK